MTRREFARFCAAVSGAAALPAPSAEGDDKLQSELLCDLIFEKGATNAVGSVGVDRLVITIAAGTFDGPRMKGTVVAPSGDWMIARPDGSKVVDLRLVLQTDDAQKIYMNSRGIAYTPPGGGLFARIQPMFETSAVKYAWLNNVVAVGVYRPMPSKISYRVYQIL